MGDDAQKRDTHGAPPTHARRYALDVQLHPPKTKPERPTTWPPGRWAILAAVGSLFAASLIAWFRLNGHPIATWIAALPQVGFVFGGIVSVLGSGGESADGWHREIAAAITALADRYTEAVVLAVILLDIAVLWVGFSMQGFDVRCPSGFRLRYGMMNAEVACDVREEQIWMPFGPRSTLANAWCVPPGGTGGWSPRFHYDASHVGVRRDDHQHEQVSCYEDGAHASVVPPHGTYRYLEWGWNERAQQVTLAPCAHLPPGLYDYDAELHACTFLGGPEYLTDLFESAYADGSRRYQQPLAAARARDEEIPLPPPDDRDFMLWWAIRDLAAATCADDCEGADAHPNDVPAPVTDAPDPHRCLPAALASDRHFTFYYPHGCEGSYGALSVHTGQMLEAADVGVGISFRGIPGHRCAPVDARRDGFIHLFLEDAELVFGITKPGSDLVLIETIAGSSKPASFDTHCPE